MIMRFILLLLLIFLGREAFGAETVQRQATNPEAVQRQGTMVGEDGAGPVARNATTSVKLIIPGGESIEIPPELVNRMDPDDVTRLIKQQTQSPIAAVIGKDILVPFIVFATAAVIVFIVGYFQYRSRKDKIDTIRLAIEKGQALPEGIMASLEKRPAPNTQGDLRKAVLLGCLGAGAAIVLFVANKQEPEISLLGLVPCILGAGYLFLWWQASKTPRRLEHERA